MSSTIDGLPQNTGRQPELFRFGLTASVISNQQGLQHLIGFGYKWIASP